MKIRMPFVWLLGLGILLCCLVAAAPLQAKSSKKNKDKKDKNEIEFPAGFDDALIGKIKAGESIKAAMAILDFEDNDKLDGKVDLRMAEMLTTSLVQTDRFELVERNKIKQLIQEQKLGMVGIIDETTAAEMGKILGAEYIVTGAITSAAKSRIDKFGYILVEVKIGVDVRAVNSTTGRILLSEAAEGLSSSKEIRTADGTIVQGALEDDQAYAAAAREAVEKVSEKIAALSSLVGYVVLTEVDEVTIDLGDDNGVLAGDRFVVFRVGDEIVHPVSGKHMGWKKEILQEVEIEHTEKGMSTAKVLKSKAAAEPGDMVISR
jgi:curli biogenesis system outer membrane secretion channel CsgG